MKPGQALVLAIGGSFALICRGARAGRDRRRRDRQGEGAAGRRPGGDLGGTVDAGRPAAAALAPDSPERAAEPGAHRQGDLPPAGPRGGDRRRRARTASARRGSGRLPRRASRSRRSGSGRPSSPIWREPPSGVEASAEAEAAAPAGARRRCRRSPAAAATAAPRIPPGRGDAARRRPPPSTGWRLRPPAAGIALIVNSGFRSDAEQAALFAANPDPRWVAPPGHSLHRCATELDLGPDSAYGWLAANAARFGFVQRYSWEAWHYGYARPPGALLGGGQLGRPAAATAVAGAGGCRASSPPASGRR